jgi:hypothetical protein
LTNAHPLTPLAPNTSADFDIWMLEFPADWRDCKERRRLSERCLKIQSPLEKSCTRVRDDSDEIPESQPSSINGIPLQQTSHIMPQSSLNTSSIHQNSCAIHLIGCCCYPRQTAARPLSRAWVRSAAAAREVCDRPAFACSRHRYGTKAEKAYEMNSR